MDTVVVRILGGLGNQMFQYALGRQLSLVRGSELRLDLDLYNHPERSGPQDTIRYFQLNEFNIEADSITDEERNRYFYLSRSRKRFLFSWIPSLRWAWVTDQKINNGLQSFSTIKGNLYLDGYWQSPFFFEGIRDVLVKEFVPRKPYLPESQDLINRIQNTNAISLHVRRGDYVSSPSTYAYHGVCSVEYYQEALRLIGSRVQDPHIFIFSDDIPWVKQNLPVPHPVEYVSLQDEDRDAKEMALMSQCRHNIIANSSYSWWGAWLNTNPEKMVIAPSRWFLAEKTNKVQLPEDWIRI